MEDKKSLVAVIMAVYVNDNIDHVKDALASLYSQYCPVDIYLQKDGFVSPELSEFLNDELSMNKINYIGHRDENKGLAFSLNQLLDIVLKKRYKYIARMDADDLSDSMRIEKQLQFMDINSSVDLCGTHIKEFSEEYDYEKIVKYPLRHKEMFDFFRYRVPVAHVSVMFRADCFSKCGVYPISGHISNEDMLLWMNAFSSGCVFANIDYVGVHVRVGDGFFSRRSGLAKVISDFKNRILVARKLRFGVKAYISALLFVFLSIMPPSIKKFLYLGLR